MSTLWSKLGGGVIAAIVVGGIMGTVLLCWWIGILIDCCQDTYTRWRNCCSNNYPDENCDGHSSGRRTPVPMETSGIMMRPLPPSYSSIFNNEAYIPSATNSPAHQANQRPTAPPIEQIVREEQIRLLALAELNRAPDYEIIRMEPNGSVRWFFTDQKNTVFL